ncbi:amidohydrolase family protein [Herbiconiux sp. KACC 21604]|uniref:amidohydrolase n=1 Tax=unclassified Herbiconiux TaxID=2618217 RepID=UPI00149260F1|nr:amidohydrolase family protein [Herbiconiux sp. SALV-R1]QJU52983.1 amidohydrolase family protein [Herbiconiux sp. SALV-R1]WPO87912.1 amidohydrolase family protein [Herbiconiux sp. KACC 21604]
MSSVLLTDARLAGGDGSAVDITVIDGVVTAIVPAGRAGSAMPATTPADRIALDGRWVLPGLWDEHVHFTQWASVSRRLDVSAAASAAETAALVGDALRRAASRPAGAPSELGEPGAPELLIGYGFRDALWPDTPSAALLNAVSGAHPVVLVSGDLHCCWLNTAALERFGQAGHPDGVLREEPAFAVHRALDDVPVATSDAWAREASQAAAARGVVGIVDLEMAWNHEVWSRRLAAGHDLLRVEFGVYPQHLDRAIAEGLHTGDPLDAAALVRVGPSKIITDGSLNTRTAFCFDEYPGLEGRPESRGLLTVHPDDLLELLRRGSAGGLTPAVHAIGDHANALTLDAFEALRAERPADAPAPRRRSTLEHAQLLAESDFERFARLGVVASVQPEHAMDDRDVADRFWAGRTGRSFALASLLAAGAELALGSDAPVAPLDPWVTLAAAVGRTRDGREPWHPEQRIPVGAALAASARGRTGVAVGDPADLVAVDLDPFDAAPDALRTMPVALTLLSGRVTHSAL